MKVMKRALLALTVLCANASIALSQNPTKEILRDYEEEKPATIASKLKETQHDIIAPPRLLQEMTVTRNNLIDTLAFYPLNWIL